MFEVHEVDMAFVVKESNEQCIMTCSSTTRDEVLSLNTTDAFGATSRLYIFQEDRLIWGVTAQSIVNLSTASIPFNTMAMCGAVGNPAYQIRARDWRLERRPRQLP